jgi:soluble lytic murein transglycosylase-like protein
MSAMSKFFAPFALALMSFLLPLQAFADVFKYVDASGHVFYTDKPKHSGFKMILKSPPPVFYTPRLARQQPVSAKRVQRSNQLNVARAQRQMEYAPLIDAAAYKYSLDPALLHAVIRAESGYNPGAVSNKGAAGLMQLMPATASRFGVRDRFDPQDNIEGGARYLSQLLDMFPWDVKLAVAAYNSGENAVKRHGNQIPPIAETRNYVDRVLGYYYR